MIDGTPATTSRITPPMHAVADVSDESGRQEVYVRPWDGSGTRAQVSTDGGSEACWSPDGRRLFYRSGRRMVGARITTAPSLAVTAREVLFEGDYLPGTYHRNYDVAPDGRHFVLLQPAGDPAGQIVVVLDWLDQMRARLRAAR